MERDRRWWQRIGDRVGPERLAAVLAVPVLILFLIVLAALVASGR